MTTQYSLNPLSLQFKLKSPVLVGASSSSRTCRSGPSEQAIQSPPFSSTHLSSSRSELSISPVHGYLNARQSEAKLGHPLSREIPNSSNLGNLATAAEGTSTYWLPQSLAVGNMEGRSIFQELQGRSFRTVMPSPPRDDSRRFFEDSRMDLIHIQVHPQVRKNGAPMFPPGFHPLTQGSAGFSNGNYHLVEKIFNRQVELEEKLKSDEKKQTHLIQCLLNLKYYEIEDKLEKMEEKTGRVNENLNGRIEVLQSRNDEREAIYSQIASTSQEKKKNLVARLKLLRDQNNERGARKEKNKTMEKEVLKVLGFGGILAASIGTAYLLLKK